MADGPDVTVHADGSMILFFLHTTAAREWVEEHVPEPLWFGAALACELRYMTNLVEGMMGDGLTLV